MSEWEKRLEQPSVPLVAKGPPGPPKIVEIEKKYSAIEGSILFTLPRVAQNDKAFAKMCPINKFRTVLNS